MKRPLILAILGAGLVMLSSGCADRDEDLAPPDAVYTVRGEVVATPAPGNRSLLVRHESIPDFRSRTGDANGMDSMTMPFTVSRDLSLENLEEGDAIELDFEVRWESDPILRVVRIEELPTGTALDFSPLPDTEESASERPPGDATRHEANEDPESPAPEVSGIEHESEI